MIHIEATTLMEDHPLPLDTPNLDILRLDILHHQVAMRVEVRETTERIDIVIMVIMGIPAILHLQATPTHLQAIRPPMPMAMTRIATPVTLIATPVIEVVVGVGVGVGAAKVVAREKVVVGLMATEEVRSRGVIRRMKMVRKRREQEEMRWKRRFCLVQNQISSYLTF